MSHTLNGFYHLVLLNKNFSSKDYSQNNMIGVLSCFGLPGAWWTNLLSISRQILDLDSFALVIVVAYARAPSRGREIKKQGPLVGAWESEPED